MPPAAQETIAARRHLTAVVALKRLHAVLQDLRQLEEQHGQSELVLHMQFKRGLHPFYPPTVQLVRPRCRAPLLGALSSHPMLQVVSWDPWRPQKDLIEQLRIFLQVRCPNTFCQFACFMPDS